MYADMLHLADRWQGFALFYNGAKCGASAPDHAHLQAARCADVPLLVAIIDGKLAIGEPLCGNDEACLYNVEGYVVPFFMIASRSVPHSVQMFRKLTDAMSLIDGEPEPRMNVMAYYSQALGYVTVVMPRSAHRPACYYADGPKQRLVSPGALDMAGLIVTPREYDFNDITADEAASLLREVAISQSDASVVLGKLKEIV